MNPKGEKGYSDRLKKKITNECCSRTGGFYSNNVGLFKEKSGNLYVKADFPLFHQASTVC